MINISLQAEKLGYLFGIPITNSLLLSLITGLVLVGGGILVARSLKMIPGKAQGTAELLIDGSLDFMAQVVGDRKQALLFFPLVASVFFFILFNNWIGIMPGIGSIGVWESVNGYQKLVPLFRPAAADLNTTFALAIVAVIAVQLFAIKKLGFFAQVGKYIDFKHGPIHFFVGILELLGEFARVLSFSFRLFGNIFAGVVLLKIVAFLVPYIVPLPFIFLEIFIGFIQALVFAMLTLVFLKVASMEVEHV